MSLYPPTPSNPELYPQPQDGATDTGVNTYFFTTPGPGTFVVDSAANKKCLVKVSVVGGGGGGGSSQAYDTAPNIIATGGGGGASSDGIVTTEYFGNDTDVITFNVGDGGAGGLASGFSIPLRNGVSGGVSSATLPVIGTITSQGGGGGYYINLNHVAPNQGEGGNGGQYGGGGGGQVLNTVNQTIPGGTGTIAAGSSSTNGEGANGGGGSGLGGAGSCGGGGGGGIVGGGVGGSSTGAVGGDATYYGAGGGGGGCTYGQTNAFDGGKGGGGYVLIQVFPVIEK